jgi:HSP20 family protein
MKMALRDLVPWRDGSRNVSVQGNETGNPFLALHREMNRMFDEALRSFDIGSYGSPAMMGWPSVELNETETEVKVVAELPGLDQNDVAIELSDGMLAISGEKKSETEDKGRRFSVTTDVSSDAFPLTTSTRTRLPRRLRMASSP